MRLIFSDFRKGVVKLSVDCDEDLYYLDKLISGGDVVRAVSQRTVKKGSKEVGVRKSYFISLAVAEVLFREEPVSLRVRGKILESNSDDVPLGSFHTFSVELGSVITIEKKFSKTERLLIDKALKAGVKVLLAVVDVGEAHFGILSGTMIKKVGGLSENISIRSKSYEQDRIDFFKTFAKTLENLFFDVNAKLCIVGFLGFIDDAVKPFLSSRISASVYFCKINNTTRSGLSEIVKSGAISRFVKECEVELDVRLLEEFFTMLSKGGKVEYGLDRVFEKAQIGAVEKLLVSDKLLRDRIVRELIGLVESNAGIVNIISSSHDRGLEFFDFCGVAAFLRF